jgi:MscS family membrane protein
MPQDSTSVVQAATDAIQIDPLANHHPENAGRLWEWFQGIVPESVTEFFTHAWYHNTVWEWTVALATMLLSVIIAKIIYWLIGKYVKRLASKTTTRLDDILIDKLEEPIVLAIVIVGLWWSIEHLTFTTGFQNLVNNVFHVLIAIDITWLLARVIDAMIAEYLLPMVEKSENDLDDQLMPILRKGVKVIIWTIGIIVGLNNAGYNVGALLAGVGIGGLAMAMAAKDFVANIFGGITVFIDKPFTLNDRIQVNGFDGTVTEIGIRSSRMKTLAGRMVTIPNKVFTDSFVENVSMEPTRKMILKLGLTYDTSPEKMELAMSILHKIVDEFDELDDERIIGFDGFGDFSMVITFMYYILKDQDIMQTNSKVHLAILKRFNAEGLEFAFPTQTVHATIANGAGQA